jgi:hypothetical protein
MRDTSFHKGPMHLYSGFKSTERVDQSKVGQAERMTAHED